MRDVVSEGLVALIFRLEVENIVQMKHQLDATLCRFYFCRVTLHVSGVKRPSSPPDDGRLRPKHVE